jgi:hypothetical protein
VAATADYIINPSKMNCLAILVGTLSDNTVPTINQDFAADDRKANL